MRAWLTAAAMATLAGAATAGTLPPGPDLNDMIAAAPGPPAMADYVQRDVMIPMRDGVKLHTVIVIPKNARQAPILLTRTPYDASSRAKRSNSTHAVARTSQSDESFVADGYIRVFQDIRGKYGSQGAYVMTRPVRGPLNPTTTDETTDAWDTIDWLVKNTPESNGKVGMIGSSYEGFTVVMALLDPHPALKAAVPESPMVDGWMGDDWFHYGAFRQPNIDYVTGQTTRRTDGDGAPRETADDYQGFLDGGSVDGWAQAHNVAGYPWLERMEAHPAYDAFWQGQALDKLIAAHPSTVPTMWEQGLWDQEDMWGAIHCWQALKAKGRQATNFLVMGPWRHSGANYEGRSLGPLQFSGDTALQWRLQVLKPFLDQYLKDGAPKADTPPVFIYDTGENRWDRLPDWPKACDQGCGEALTPLYLAGGFSLDFNAPATAGADAYVSDPAKPVPFLPPPVSFSETERWRTWLVTDQRFVASRPDVLAYETAPLTAPVRLAGAPVADLYAATSGTDGDFVVKLIDVYPAEVPSEPTMSGYELPIAMDIFRGRYRDSFEHPAAIPAGQVERYRFALPNANHVFRTGHRIMVQIQSSWFPLYDRNPQTFTPNIFYAKPADYVAATVRISRAPGQASAIWLPIVADLSNR
ncbi:MAG TPA: CocE/NonD family hydrolase [Caulobacteraceae bacterium]